MVTAILDFLTGDPRRAHILTHAFPASPLLQRRRIEIIRTMAAIFAAQTKPWTRSSSQTSTWN